jgi:RNA polymerase sigma-70 factor (ECF subfamily)
MHAWERDDVAALTSLLHEEARISMPPSPSWYQGREAISTFWRAVSFRTGGRWRLRPTSANMQAGFGLYLRDPAAHEYQAHGLQVLTLMDQQITELTTFFTPSLFTYFGLPSTVPA